MRHYASTTRAPSALIGGGAIIMNHSSGDLVWPRTEGRMSIRTKITKQKKKRLERKARRAKMAERGIPLPKPPNYMSKLTPVENVIPAEQVEAEIRLHDEMVKLDLEQRRKEMAKEEPLRHHMSSGSTTIQMSDRVRKLFDLNNGNQREVVQYQKQRGMKLFELREGDTGSSAVQVVAVTSRIQQLQTHIRQHKKDNSTKRGLERLMVRRRKLLDYMERKEFDSYRRVVKTLGLSRR